MTASDQDLDALLARLTLEEKAALTAGADAWRTVAVPRLGIGALKVTDGPNGARGDGVSGARAACFPVGVAWAPRGTSSSWVAWARPSPSRRARRAPACSSVRPSTSRRRRSPGATSSATPRTRT